jgi:hypothetical protein
MEEKLCTLVKTIYMKFLLTVMVILLSSQCFAQNKLYFQIFNVYRHDSSEVARYADSFLTSDRRLWDSSAIINGIPYVYKIFTSKSRCSGNIRTIATVGLYAKAERSLISIEYITYNMSDDAKTECPHSGNLLSLVNNDCCGLVSSTTKSHVLEWFNSLCEIYHKHLAVSARETLKKW